MSNTLRTLLVFYLPLAAAEFVPAGSAAEPAEADARFFEEQVRPVLAEHCYSCHGEDKQRGELRVDSLAALRNGGESGPALVPKKPDESLLVEAIRFESFEMPPSGQLPEKQIAAIVRWIKIGAPWPGHDDQVRQPVPALPKITDEDRAYWAFQPIRDPSPPQVEDDGWCRNDMDPFIYRALDREGLAPSEAASHRALIRRLSFDLTGLPPTPDQVEDFLADDHPHAYERLVDRLLESPRYGERWARHWLDLVRYAESDGFRQDAFRSHAWRYRDYVIRAFNEDKPYDLFVLEQLAGDEIAPHDTDALAASSYLRHWIYEYNQRDVRTQWENILVDITNVTGEVFLGLGFGCARCHDHKFDPILQEDYYRLKAFFTPLLPRDDLAFASAEQWQEFQQQQSAWERATAEIREQMEQLERPLTEQARKRAGDKFPPDIRVMLAKEPKERTPLEHQLAEMAYRQAKGEIQKLDFSKSLKGDQKSRWEALRKQLDQSKHLKPEPLPPAFTVRDVGSQAPPTIVSGDRRGRDIAPGFLAVLDTGPLQIQPPPGGESTGRRTALARWLTSRENPLTARVIVNRVWQQHFGVGLVSTASDFGRLGESPSHPELLDWLASRFIENGWHFKPLHRLIVTSATYRQSALRPRTELAARVDPGNRLLWRMNVRRLDAEQIRDNVLAVTGELETSDGGPSVDASRPRRTIYTKAIRNRRDPLLQVFDGTDGFGSVDRRNVTTTPTQSLFMFNGPWPLSRAAAMAKRLAGERLAGEKLDMAGKVDLAFRLAYGRAAEPEECQQALAFLAQQERLDVAGDAEQSTPSVVTEMPGRKGNPALEADVQQPLRDSSSYGNHLLATTADVVQSPRMQALVDFCHILLNSNEFIYVD